MEVPVKAILFPVRHRPCSQLCVTENPEKRERRRAGIGGGGAKALAGSIKLRGCSVVHNTAIDGGAFEVAKQAQSNGIPTRLVVEARPAPDRSYCLRMSSTSRRRALAHRRQGTRPHH